MEASEERILEPKIIAFCCANSAYKAADVAGTMRCSYPQNVDIVRVPCSGKVDIQYILKAFENGADGVLVLACYEDGCKYLTGNIRAKKRVAYAKHLLEEIGMQGERVRMDYITSTMGTEFARIAREMTEHIRSLGPV